MRSVEAPMEMSKARNLTVTVMRPWCRCLSRSVVPPLGHQLAAPSARERISAVMAVPLNRRAPLDDLPAVLTLERRHLQPRAGAARSGERYLAREFASLFQ
jgi:hypothetical protein